MRALPAPPLLVISDRRQAALPLERVASKLLDAGCRWFSLREKDLPREDLTTLIKELLPSFESRGALLSLHDDDARLADELGLGALHLSGKADVGAARRRLREGVLIGQSCHSLAELERAADGGADYVMLSPFFASSSKPGYRPLSEEESRALLAAAPLPVLALGGIESPETAKACRARGVAGLAVMGAVLRSERPGEVFSALAAAWEGAA